MTIWLIVSYLAAIVTANNVVTYFGPMGLLVTGFILIPFDLVARDALQERWRSNLKLKMGSLILGGSILAFLTNPATFTVAKASAISFMIAGLFDWLVYTIAQNKSRFFRMNASNLASASIDSVIFQIIAFGSFSWQLAGSQASIKIFGAFLWTLLLVKLLDKIR